MPGTWSNSTPPPTHTPQWLVIEAGCSPTGSTQNPLADSLATLGLAQRGEVLADKRPSEAGVVTTSTFQAEKPRHRRIREAPRGHAVYGSPGECPQWLAGVFRTRLPGNPGAPCLSQQPHKPGPSRRSSAEAMVHHMPVSGIEKTESPERLGRRFTLPGASSPAP